MHAPAMAEKFVSIICVDSTHDIESSAQCYSIKTKQPGLTAATAETHVDAKNVFLKSDLKINVFCELTDSTSIQGKKSQINFCQL